MRRRRGQVSLRAASGEPFAALNTSAKEPREQNSAGGGAVRAALHQSQAEH